MLHLLIAQQTFRFIPSSSADIAAIMSGIHDTTEFIGQHAIGLAIARSLVNLKKKSKAKEYEVAD